RRASYRHLADVAVTAGLPLPQQSAMGFVNFQDVDLTDQPQASASAQGGGVGYLGSFSIDPIFTSGPGQGTVVWHFTVDNSALQSLAGDEHVTQYYNVAIDDQHGGIATQLISVTLNGVDDAPVVSNDTGSANEAGGTNN